MTGCFVGVAVFVLGLLSYLLYSFLITEDIEDTDGAMAIGDLAEGLEDASCTCPPACLEAWAALPPPAKWCT